MKTNQGLIKSVVLILIVSMPVSLQCQFFIIGGYQGGTHGNVKEKTWSGAVDEKWNVAGNWGPAGVPGLQDDEIIPATAVRMPVVMVQDLGCNNITISMGAMLTINPGVILTINGQMKIEGQ
jgi:hypothetical protein